MKQSFSKSTFKAKAANAGKALVPKAHGKPADVLYAEITGSDPGWPGGEADERPANNVSWTDAVAFAISSQSERGSPLATGSMAKRATTARYSFGDDEGQLGEHAWFEANSNNEPQPVGRKAPNPWSLHDMHGNVYEWCWDWYGGYTEAALSDPVGPPVGDARVLRGGAFYDPPRVLRSAYRFRFLPSGRGGGFGFRCARGASPP